MVISEEKASLRSHYRQRRHERYIESSFEYLASIPEILTAETIATYLSYGDEPETERVNSALLAMGKRLLLPRIADKNLEWVEWSGDESHLHIRKKIKEPIGSAISQLEVVDVVIVPALSIDRSGYRLGQGGGYYDRALPALRAWSIGLIHPDEISSIDLPRDEWDQPLSAAATPDLILRFNR